MRSLVLLGIGIVLCTGSLTKLRHLSEAINGPRLLGELQTANTPILIGGGAQGEVYLGNLHGKPVAVKLPKGKNGNVIPDILVYLHMSRDGVDMTGIVKTLGYLVVQDTLGSDGPDHNPVLTLKYESLEGLRDVYAHNMAIRALKQRDSVYGVVMELLSGGELGNADPPRPIETVAELLLDAFTTVENMHRHGYVFRDFKPDNVMVSNGQAKLIDLGLTHAISDSKSLTSYGGAPAFQFSRHVLSLSDFGYNDRFAVGMSLLQVVLPNLYSRIGHRIMDGAFGFWSISEYLETVSVDSVTTGYTRDGNRVVSDSGHEISTSISVGIWEILKSALLPRNMNIQEQVRRGEIDLPPYSQQVLSEARLSVSKQDSESKYYSEDYQLLEEVAADLDLKRNLQRFINNLGYQSHEGATLLSDPGVTYVYRWSSWNYLDGSSTAGYGETGQFYSVPKHNIVYWKSTDSNLELTFADVQSRDMALQSMNQPCKFLMEHHESKDYKKSLLSVRHLLTDMYRPNPFARNPVRLSSSKKHTGTQCTHDPEDTFVESLSFPHCDSSGTVYVPPSFTNNDIVDDTFSIRKGVSYEDQMVYLNELTAAVKLVLEGKSVYSREYRSKLVRLHTLTSEAIKSADRYGIVVGAVGPELLSEPGCRVFFHLGEHYSVFVAPEFDSKM